MNVYDKDNVDHFEGIRLDARNATAFFYRAIACDGGIVYDKAISDFYRVIDPKYVNGFIR